MSEHDSGPRRGTGDHSVVEKIMEIVFEWNDVFDIGVYPAVSAEEGLRIGSEVFPRLARMQQQA